MEKTLGCYQGKLLNFQKETLTQVVDKPGSSQFWPGLMRVKPIFYRFCERIVVSGNNVLVHLENTKQSVF
jgi:hypothetical protein